jgi:hypothetical protein
LFFVNKQQWRHFGKGTQCGTVLQEMLTELFVRSYFQQNKPLIYFFSFLWHKTIVFISNMFIYSKIDNSKFVEMHGTLPDIYPSALVFYTRDRVNITIYTKYKYKKLYLNLVHVKHIQTDNDKNKTYIIQCIYSACKHTFTQALKC